MTIDGQAALWQAPEQAGFSAVACSQGCSAAALACMGGQQKIRPISHLGPFVHTVMLHCMNERTGSTAHLKLPGEAAYLP